MTPSFKAQGSFKEIKGSILSPHNSGLRFVLNVVSTKGKAEGPLFDIFNKKWSKVREDVKGWYNTRTGAYKIGATLSTPVQSDVWVVSCLCQDDNGETDLKGLEECLKQVSKSATYERATLHVSQLLIDSIPEITDLLSKQMIANGVSVYMYTE